MTGATIRVQGLGRRYGARDVVRDVDLALAAGECVALVGHNGAGKSTLIKMMLGLVPPTSGRVEILGTDPHGRGASRLRRHIGFLPENVVFPPGLTGRETLAFYARLKREPLARNAGLLERVGLADAADRRVGTYSKGMRQRLGLAQALLGTPRVLLLDEPTSGLDPASRQTFYGIVRELAATGVTVLLSSHALGEIEDRTHRIAVMSGGRLVACGSLDRLRREADLPVRMRVRLAEGEPVAGEIAAGFGIATPVAGGRLELACATAAKMDLLRRVAASPAVTDVEVLPPTLDDLYARFMRDATP